MSNYHIIRKDREETSNYNPHGGVAILIEKKIKYLQLDIRNPNPNSEATAILTKINNDEICLISIYCKPNHKITLAEWSVFKNQFNNAYMLFGDFNASHPLWGNNSCMDYEGEQLEKFINNFNLIILNNEAITRVPRPNWRDTIIDLTITSPNLSMIIEEWTVLSDPCNSDHYPILITIVENERTSTTIIKRKNFKQADWSKYNQYIKFQLESTNILEIDYKQFIEIINRASELSIPYAIIKNFSKKKGAIPLWDSECNKAVAQRKLALSRFNRSGNLNEYLEYRELKTKLKIILKRDAQMNG